MKTNVIQITRKELDPQNFNFLEKLQKDDEINAFLTWGRNRWKTELNQNISKVLDEKQSIITEKMGEMMEGEGKDYKNKIKELKDLIKAEVRDRILDNKEEIIKIKEKVKLGEKTTLKGNKFERRAWGILGKEFPHWDFQATDSKIGDCVITPRIRNSVGDYEKTEYKILMENKDQESEKVGSSELTKLKEDMNKRDIELGVIITKSKGQLIDKYQPLKLERKVIITYWENRRLALRVLEILLKTLKITDKKEKRELNYQKISSVAQDIVKKYEDKKEEIERHLKNNIEYAKKLETKISKELRSYEREVIGKVKSKILTQINQDKNKLKGVEDGKNRKQKTN